MYVRDQATLVEGNKLDAIEVMVFNLMRPALCSWEVYLSLKNQGQAVITITIAGSAGISLEETDILRSTQVTGCLFKLEDFLQIVQLNLEG